MPIIPLKKPERENEYGKVHIIGTSREFQEKHYCQMCEYMANDSLMKYNEDTKVWQCWRCGYVLDPGLGQTPKTEDKPTIENNPTSTKPIVIPLKNFSFNASYNNNNNTLEKEESSIRPRPVKYQSAREAWEDDSR